MFTAQPYLPIFTYILLPTIANRLAFLIGLLFLVIIFFMLTALFKSLIDPFVIMFAIPFGFIGVVIGHAVFGYNIQFLSMVGTLALSGIIVNDSLIMVDFIKKLRHEGKDKITAVINAGKVRARPIILTSVTTFLGISPLIFFATGQTAFLSPMAVLLQHSGIGAVRPQQPCIVW